MSYRNSYQKGLFNQVGGQEYEPRARGLANVVLVLFVIGLFGAGSFFL